MNQRLLVVAALFSSVIPAQTRYDANWKSLDARPVPGWYTEAKFGIFIHWGIYSVPAFAPVGKYAEWYWNALSHGPTENGKPNPTWAFHQRVYGADFDYSRFAQEFKAELYDPAYWADVFAKSGAKYVVLTSKHHDGFALWPSKEADRDWNRPWNAVSTGPHRNVAGDLAAAVRNRGLRMGYYYSLYEWFNPIWLADRKRFVNDHMVPQFKNFVNTLQPAVIFSDGEWDMPAEDWRAPELLAWVYNESPVGKEVVVNDRWGKGARHHHGDYYTTEYTAGLEGNTHPWEENRGMGFSYGYNRAEQLKDYRTNRELVLMLIDLVSRGGNLLLDIGPTGDGRIPVIMQDRLIAMGKWLERNGESIYGTKPWNHTRQWSEGEQQKLQTGEFMTKYEVTDYTDRKRPGQAVIETFFTAKGSDVYAIIPGWPGRQLTLKNVSAPKSMQPQLLGGPTLKWTTKGANITIDLPEPSADSAKSQYAWVIKLPGLSAK